MTVELMPSAIEDLSNGCLFYERQGSDLGTYFLNSLFTDIDSLTLYAGTHAKCFGYHRMLSRRFPYAAYYKVRPEGVLVFRVLDLRSSPARIRRDLTGVPVPTQVRVSGQDNAP